MEEVRKDSSSASATAGKSASRLLRYPLRSATKHKEEKPPLADASNYPTSATRGRTPSIVSKSVSVLELPGKEKSAKPSRRLSVPSKSSASPSPNLVGNITPTSEAKPKKSSGNQGKSDTPVADVSIRRKFNVLSSASYWQSQIKISESAAKHFISIGFFKLALEAGCEPVQLLRDELKSYVRRHDFNQHGETVKELFERYNIMEDYEQVQVSDTCSHVAEEETRSSDDDIHSSISMKSKPPKLGATKPSQGKDTKKDTSQKNESVSKPRRSLKMDSANSKAGLKSGSGRIKQKKAQKQKKEEPINEYDSVTKQDKESAHDQCLNDSPSAKHDELQEYKENLEAVQTEDLKLEA